jgi:hypothetical protein
MASHSRLYGLARAARRVVGSPVDSSSLGDPDFQTAVRAVGPAERRSMVIVDRPGWRTILTPEYRGPVVDDNDVRIRQGVEVVKGSLSSLADRSRRDGVKFLVVLIPTKETVFWSQVEQTNGVLSRMFENETRLRMELIDYLNSHDIDFVDVTDGLRATAHQPYFENTDGHPNAWGHRLIADAIIAHDFDSRQRTYPNSRTPR